MKQNTVIPHILKYSAGDKAIYKMTHANRTKDTCDIYLTVKHRARSCSLDTTGQDVITDYTNTSSTWLFINFLAKFQ
jgi:hypothetical protein